MFASAISVEEAQLGVVAATSDGGADVVTWTLDSADSRQNTLVHVARDGTVAWKQAIGDGTVNVIGVGPDDSVAVTLMDSQQGPNLIKHYTANGTLLSAVQIDAGVGVAALAIDAAGTVFAAGWKEQGPPTNLSAQPFVMQVPSGGSLSP